MAGRVRYLRNSSTIKQVAAMQPQLNIAEKAMLLAPPRTKSPKRAVRKLEISIAGMLKDCGS